MAGDEEKVFKYRSAEDCAGAADIAVHFSNKTINSNIPGGGVRLGQEDALELPYISARCLLGAGYSLDYEYTVNNGLLNSVLAIASGENQLDTLTLNEAAEIRAVVAEQMALMQQHHETGLDVLDPRHRQLLIPDEAQESGYACITPITSVSLCQLVTEAILAHNEQQKEAVKLTGSADHRTVPVATMGFGGAKFQNVGRLTSALKNVPVFVAPQRNPAIRAALAIHHRGVELRLPELVMLQMAHWTMEVQSLNDGQIPINLETRATLQQFAEDITRYIGRRGSYALRQLKAHARHLPPAAAGEAVSLAEDVPDTTAGLIDPAQRGDDWYRSLAAAVCDAVVTYVGATESGIEWQIELQEELKEMLTRFITRELPL